MRDFSKRNLQRCESPTGFNHKISSWSLSDWTTAVAGEFGESANIIKKINRFRDRITGNAREETLEVLLSRLKDELADTLIYLDLLIQAAGFDPEEIVESKFKRTSDKIGYQE